MAEGGIDTPLFVMMAIKKGGDALRDVVNKIILDLDRRIMNHSVSAKQNDTVTRTLCFTLKNGGEVFPLEHVKLVAIKGIKPDGTSFYNDCVICGNEIRYTITNQVVAAEGTVTCALELYDSTGRQLTSPQFYIEVYSELFNDRIMESANDYSGIKEVLKTVESAVSACLDAEQRILNIVENITDYETTAREQAEQSAAYARQAEGCMISAQSAAGEAEDTAKDVASKLEDYMKKEEFILATEQDIDNIINLEIDAFGEEQEDSNE